MWFALTPWCIILLAPLSSAETWRWPEGEGRREDLRKQEDTSIKIDTRVRFLGGSESDKHGKPPDELPFHQPVDTQGFYNRPGGAGRFPVRVRSHDATSYRVDPQHMYTVTTYKPQLKSNYQSDGTLDAVQFCKCVSTPDCNPRPDTNHKCGSGQYLCCFKRPNKQPVLNPEFFNEIEDERPMLLPGRPHFSGVFPHPSHPELDDLYDHDPATFGSGRPNTKPDVLIGPEGPTGQVGPPKQPVIIGPGQTITQHSVLAGPNGPTAIIGPAPVNQNRDTGPSGSAQRGVLVGPGGPTGLIGPFGQQRPVLVGPGGPTGIIGPGRRDYNRGILTGPGGPTGVIGPGYSRRPGYGLLVGPGGPTGTIGPGRQLLVGPGGPTGTLGARKYFGNN